MKRIARMLGAFGAVELPRGLLVEPGVVHRCVLGSEAPCRCRRPRSGVAIGDPCPECLELPAPSEALCVVAQGRPTTRTFAMLPVLLWIMWLVVLLAMGFGLWLGVETRVLFATLIVFPFSLGLWAMVLWERSVRGVTLADGILVRVLHAQGMAFGMEPTTRLPWLSSRKLARHVRRHFALSESDLAKFDAEVQRLIDRSKELGDNGRWFGVRASCRWCGGERRGDWRSSRCCHCQREDKAVWLAGRVSPRSIQATLVGPFILFNVFGWLGLLGGATVAWIAPSSPPWPLVAKLVVSGVCIAVWACFAAMSWILRPWGRHAMTDRVWTLRARWLEVETNGGRRQAVPWSSVASVEPMELRDGWCGLRVRRADHAVDEVMVTTDRPRRDAMLRAIDELRTGQPFGT